MSQLILVVNSGSSSLKFSLFDIENDLELASGIAERLATDEAQLVFKFDGNKDTILSKQGKHDWALQEIMNQLASHGINLDDLKAVGHRVVHGGEYFSKSVLIDEEALNNIKACSDLAPLHNPANIEGIEAIAALYPNLPQVAVFDTAFHQTLPKAAFMYPLPYQWYEQHGVRRYGFHGTSHKYVSETAIDILGLEKSNSAIITAHLGNGASATAVLNGESVDTTMGLTPLEGLMMGTRSGNVDPSLHQFMANKTGMSLDEITDILNKKSGMLGVSQISNDMRTITAEAESGNEAAQLTLDMYVHSLSKTIASLAAAMGKLDAIVFTGGIGENSRYVRKHIIDKLAFMGFSIDAEANEANGLGEQRLITVSSSKPAIIIDTAEEWAIAQDTAALTLES